MFDVNLREDNLAGMFIKPPRLTFKLLSPLLARFYFTRVVWNEGPLTTFTDQIPPPFWILFIKFLRLVRRVVWIISLRCAARSRFESTKKILHDNLFESSNQK